MEININIIKKVFKWFIILIVFLVIIPYIIETLATLYLANNIIFHNIASRLIFQYTFITETMPDYAWVIVYKGEYYPAFTSYTERLNLHYSKGGEVNVLPDEYMMRAGEARELYEPNKEATNKGAFTDNFQFLTTSIMRKIGLLPERKSRWNEDGTWNW